MRVRLLLPPPEVSRETFEETTGLREGEMITAETNTTVTKNPPGAAVPATEENLKVGGREVVEEIVVNEAARQIVSPLSVRPRETAEVRNFCQAAGREEEIETKGHPLIAIAEDQDRG